jgi:hypothetical protein
LQKTISDYPQQVQRDFQKVISRPEVMNLLTENIDLTTSLGEDYRANRNAVIEQLDSLNNQQRKDFAEYKKDVENNPEMQKEMQSAADRFSSAYAQSDSPVDTYLNDQQDTYSNSAPVISNYYSYNPYPYWFSYPYWYATPIWYPVPYYYNTGFYYGRGGRIVIWGFPSYAYSNWFFSFGYRHYPHYYSRYNVYYHRSYAYGDRGGYHGYRSPRNEYGSRRNYNNHGNRDGNSGNGNRTSGIRNQSTLNAGRTSVSRNQMIGNNNSRTSVNRYQPMDNNNGRMQMNSNRNTSVNQNWIRSNSGGNRTFAPTRQNDFRSSNLNSRSAPQFHSSPSSSFSRQSSGGGGARGGFSGSRGGGGGHRGR